jgi:uncharacterized protein YyaL (SSP411 family)
MKHIFNFILPACVSLMALSTADAGTKPQKETASNTPTTNPSAEPVANETSAEKKIHWLTWEEMVKLNAQHPKKIFIDFYTSWCGWCKVMDRNTFDDEFVAQMMSKNFYCVKFDAERRDSIDFLDRKWGFIPGGRSGYHELAAYFMRYQLSYPTMVVLTPDYKLIYEFKGYSSPPQFEPVISYVSTVNGYTTDNNPALQQFKQAYKSARATPWVQPQQ